MTRDVVLGLGILSFALLACGGGNNKEANTSGDDWVVMNKKDMGDDAYKLPAAFGLLADKHGCATKITDEGSAAKCNDGTIVMLREGSVITIGCKNMSKSQCSALFDAIVAEGK
jgi:hypothetical protein